MMHALTCVLVLAVFHAASADDITIDVFGEDNKIKPAAFADFNSDKHTDIIVIDVNKTKGTCFVKILLSHQDPPLIRPNGPNCTCMGTTVSSVVPGDFDGDGALDLLMLSPRSSGGLYDVSVAWGNLKELMCPENVTLTVRGQPLVMDYNGDMIADLFGESENKTRSFWLFDTSRSEPKQVFLTDPSLSQISLPPLRRPSSHAFVDLNSDLAADLFITAEGQFEIWLNSGKGFKLNETIKIPSWVKVIGQTTFMDVALTGKIQAVTVFCASLDCSDGQLYVWESSKKKFTSLGLSLEDKKEGKWSFPSNSHHAYPYTDTITVRVADQDLDGYPDILLTLVDSNDNPQVLLVRNQPCSGSACSDHAQQFVVEWEFLADYPASVMATFFDVFEDGRVDIILLHEQTDNKGEFELAVVRDATQYDAMFLKVLVPSGRCYSECVNHEIPYGTSPSGPTFRYSITTQERGIQSSITTQLTQSAHMALQMPYTLFGLGRNWNFIDTLEVGLPIKETPITHFGFYNNKTESIVITESGVKNLGFPTIRNFTQIIPNSQVIIIPYPLDRPERWVNKLYITPSKALKMTAAALLGTCLLVSIIIAVLHYKEKVQDKKEKLQQAQTFHFDAM